MNPIYRTAISTVTLLGRSAAAAVCMLLALLPSACSDELDNPGGGSWPSGEPAEITVRIGLPDRRSHARGDLTPGLDNRVNTLWVGVYNVESGVRTGQAFVNVNKSTTFHNYLSLAIKTLSGRSHVVAVANYEHRFASVNSTGELIPMQAALEQADSWDKYAAIAIAFDNEGGFNIEAPLNPLVMSGHYTEENHISGDRPAMTELNIRPGMSTPSGAIHLRRLISQVKFNITYNPANVNSFSVDSYHIVNIPRQSWLHERAEGDEPANSPDDRTAAGNRYGSTYNMTMLGHTGNTYTFDFWTLENKRSGRDGVIKDWADREREYKSADGTNSGKFISLVDGIDSDNPANNATYAVFHVSMDMKVDENGNQLSETSTSRRTVEADYVIHLGYVDGLDDFNCRRNSIYTYNVTINNVNDLVVEAKTEGEYNGEKNPGTSGFVSDITDRFVELDAHYCTFNIELTADDIQRFEYMIQAPTMDGRTLLINSQNPNTVPSETDDDFIYLSWIELRYSGRQNRPVAYKPRSDSETYLLNEIKGNRDMKTGWYTVFVNEYVYEPSSAALNGDESGSGNWHKYVGLPDRRVWFNVAANISADTETIHYTSKYALSQQSIQSYYNNLPSSGLGLEHTNESMGLNLRNTFNPTGSKYRDSGRYNTWLYLGGEKGQIKWTDFVSLTNFQEIHAINNQNITRAARTEPLPRIATTSSTDGRTMSTAMKNYDPDQTSSPYYIEAITACLNRNRDLNGDGYIDKSELRWFVPTTGQMTRMILGRRSLEDPVFDPGEMTRLPNNRGDNNGHNSSMLFATSDGFMLWIMEGLSSSQWREWPASCAAPWEVRCVRNLGSNMNNIAPGNHTQVAAVKRNGENIIDLLYYDPLSVREEAYHSSDHPMPVHHINDQRYNRCYKSFEYSDEVIGLNDSRLGIAYTTIEWATYLANNNPCKYLVEKTGRDGWRVPNQKEMTMITIMGEHKSGIPSGNAFQVTCSFTYFDKAGYTPGNNPSDSDPAGSFLSSYRFALKIVNSNGNTTQSEDIGYISNAHFGVRCVRDNDD